MLEAQVGRTGGSGLRYGGSGVQTDGLHAALLPVPCNHTSKSMSNDGTVSVNHFHILFMQQ